MVALRGFLWLPSFALIGLNRAQWASTSTVSGGGLLTRYLLRSLQSGPYLPGWKTAAQQNIVASSTLQGWPVRLEKVMTPALRTALAAEGFSTCADLVALLPK
jgi:hypothetical protein